VQTGDRGGFDVELRGRAPLVRPEWLRLLVAIGADRDPAGQVLLVVEDVTARRTTSDALLAPMEARSGAYEQLQRMGDITARSLAIVSHEFRTGLFGMQGYSEILCRREFPPATVQKYAASINSDAKRMGRLINDLLDLNRMEVGREELQLEEVACGRLVAEVVERTRMGSPRHEISAVLAPDVPTIVADRDRVIQVLGNLLTNAVKYSPEGGPVVVRLGRHPEGVMIEVTDQGIGIPANMLDEVFEPFTRSQDHGASSVKGTGLGLPIVRHIVRLHGGRVWVESREGVGSTFRVVLPPHPPGAAPNQPPDDDGSAVDPAGQGGTPGSHD
jgi:signal transduction histidine kinase